ncbi:MAG TPA: PKD domain-containing protein, partial [Thermoanaerobaculia bacterium]|nr:PKD domain-containing protein [Thermoanaerobaculia bacterium]
EFTTSGTNAGFFDRSAGAPTSWSWSFGDGGTSTAQNPTHDYKTSGTFNVTLTVTNDTETSSKTKLVTVSQGDPPVADFTFQASGHSVVFADQSTGNPKRWSWDFGDGMTSTQQNPSHTYAKAGTYAVVLTASNDAGSSSKTKLVTVTDTKPPVAAFCYQRNGLQVVFVDRSENSPTSWEWDFGCLSCFDSRQNPSFTFPAAGTYQVTLTVSNDGGKSTLHKFITVNDSPAIVDSSPVCN